MIVASCQHEKFQKNGVTRAGAARFRCVLCGKSWTESTGTLGGMRIGLDRAAQIIEMLCEGVSVRATARMTKTDLKTILDLLVYVGEHCEKYMQENIRGVFVGDTQVDEIWGYVLCKQATAKRQKYVGGCGDAYCFTALDRTTKLLVSWHLGKRNEQHTSQFIAKLDSATAGHFHISTDGWRSYPTAIRDQLGGRVDHGLMLKTYAENVYEDQRRYSPSRIISAERVPITGTYYKNQICTSHVERMNGSIRNFVKRMGRLTYCFSKKWANHRAALAVFFCHYNYCRKHNSLSGQTPAMAHGLSTEAWSIRKMIELVTQWHVEKMHPYQRQIDLSNLALEALRQSLSADKQRKIDDYINRHGEMLLGMEFLVDWLIDADAKITPEQFGTVSTAMESMGQGRCSRLSYLREQCIAEDTHT